MPIFHPPDSAYLPDPSRFPDADCFHIAKLRVQDAQVYGMEGPVQRRTFEDTYAACQSLKSVAPPPRP